MNRDLEPSRTNDFASGLRRTFPIDIAASALPSPGQMLAAAKAGLVFRLNGFHASTVFDMEFLSPVMPLLSHLVIDLYGVEIRNANVLENATTLESLSWYAGTPDRAVDLKYLPQLRSYSGQIVPGIESILQSKNLTEITIIGRLPEGIPSIGAPVEKMLLSDWTSVSRLPALGAPERLLSLRVDRPRLFDGASLLPAVNLETLQLNSVGRLENVAALNALVKLERLEVEATSDEDWDLLLGSTARLALLILSPNPSSLLRKEGARRGWTVAGKHDQSSSRLWPFSLLKGDEGLGPVLHLGDFSGLSELLTASLGKERVGGLLVNGHLAQELVRAACQGDKEMGDINPEFDSESEGMYVRFPNKKLAARAATLTKAFIRNEKKLTTVIDAYEGNTL
ncbi:MAG: hypothetical protein M9882_05605 [Homoserinimonas sp.]|nr:hypothetical protein [Homoserinimonas sp.]